MKCDDIGWAYNIISKGYRISILSGHAAISVSATVEDNLEYILRLHARYVDFNFLNLLNFFFLLTFQLCNSTRLKSVFITSAFMGCTYCCVIRTASLQHRTILDFVLSHTRVLTEVFLWQTSLTFRWKSVTLDEQQPSLPPLITQHCKAQYEREFDSRQCQPSISHIRNMNHEWKE